MCGDLVCCGVRFAGSIPQGKRTAGGSPQRATHSREWPVPESNLRRFIHPKFACEAKGIRKTAKIRGNRRKQSTTQDLLNRWQLGLTGERSGRPAGGPLVLVQ
eukprot:gene22835-biopygen13322